MGTWKTRGLRGSSLEELINIANEAYREKKLALVQKIPTPITPIEIEPTTKRIKLAYFNQKSTVDYIGIVQGIAICFDAKECASDSFSLANIHLRFENLKEYWDRMLSGGRKSFTYKELDEKFKIESKKEVFLHYLERLSDDIISR